MKQVLKWVEMYVSHNGVKGALSWYIHMVLNLVQAGC